MVELRRADASRSLDVLGTGPGHPTLIDQGRGCRHDAISGAWPFRVIIDGVYDSGVDNPKTRRVLWSNQSNDVSEAGMATDTPTISDQARALASGPAATMPADVMAAFAAEQAALETRGVPQNVVAPGTVMPDGELLDMDGAPTSLARLRAGRPRSWCSIAGRGARTATSRCAPTKPNWFLRWPSAASS